MQPASRPGSAPLFVALLANVVLFVVLAASVAFDVGAARPPAPEDPCDASALWSELTELRRAIADAEQALDRALTSLEQAAAREQLDGLVERLEATEVRADRCDIFRPRLRCGTE